MLTEIYHRGLKTFLFCVFLTGIILTMGSATRGRSKSSLDSPRKILSPVQDSGRQQIIVRLDLPTVSERGLGASAVQKQRALIAKAQSKIETQLAATDSKMGRRLKSVPLLAVEVDEAGLRELAKSEVVETIRLEKHFRPLGTEISPRLNKSTPHVQATELHDTATGSNRTLAVLDTGFDTHPAFGTRKKFVAEACFSDGDCPDGSDKMFGPTSASPIIVDGDTKGHGTHVASIAAGRPVSGLGLDSGVAPGAQLVGVNVFHADGGEARADESDILAALEWLADVAADSGVVSDTPVAAVNLSLGGGKYVGECDDRYPDVYRVFDNLRAAGIVPVVASGNDGWTSAVSWPACFSNTVAVGATNISDGEDVADFSNQHPEVTSLVAPGKYIDAAVPGNEVGKKRGTSMAAPHVAGGVAVLAEALQKAGTNTDPDKILSALRTAGRPVEDYRSSENVYSSIRLLRAYRFLTGSEDFVDFSTRFEIVPNPYRPGDGNPRTGTGAHGINFINLPDDFELSVYALTGEEIFSRSVRNSGGRWEWYPLDPASGTYFVVVKDVSTNKVEKRKLGIVK